MVNKIGGRTVSVWRKQTSVSRDSGSVSGRPGDKTALHAQKEVGLWGRGRKTRRRWRSSGWSDFTVVVSLCYIHVYCIKLAYSIVRTSVRQHSKTLHMVNFFFIFSTIYIILQYVSQSEVNYSILNLPSKN